MEEHESSDQREVERNGPPAPTDGPKWLMFLAGCYGEMLLSVALA